MLTFGYALVDHNSVGEHVVRAPGQELTSAVDHLTARVSGPKAPSPVVST